MEGEQLGVPVVALHACWHEAQVVVASPVIEALEGGHVGVTLAEGEHEVLLGSRWLSQCGRGKKEWVASKQHTKNETTLLN